MGTSAYGKAVFPLNAGKRDTDILEATAQNQADYDYGSHFARTTEAYLSVSVNPTIVQNNLQYENSVSGSSLVNSANFMEIRNTSHGGAISNDYGDKIGNRLYPGNNTLTDYAINRDETHSFKVKVFDSQLANSETNRKFVYSTSDYPATEEVGLDIENYDYFILLNPDTYQMGTDTLRPHFAKVTRIISFDEFGDGLEFSPAYPTEVSINTKFEIYKGPAKTATDIVAVSYGLRGDTSTSTPKHDRVAHCSRPTWYFYNDRLDEKDQLDYMTKYNLTHLRWWNYPTTLVVTAVDAHAQYEAGSSSKEFTLNDANDDLKLSIGMSVFNASNVLLGNITNVTALTNKFRIDYARIAISGTTTNFDIKIGKTAHNVAFRTEGKFGNTIHSLGKDRMEATLVDANKTSDDSNSSNFHKWENAFPKMHRHTANSDSVTANTLDGNMTGPGKYITFEKANFKNNKIPLITEAILNQPRNKMSQLAQFNILDNSGIQHMKIKEEDTLVLERNIHNDNLALIAFEGKAARDSSNTSIIVMSDIRKQTDLRNILGNDDIIEIDGYHYAVASVAAQSGGTQNITIKNKKLKTANTWSGSAVAENFSGKTLFLPPYTGVINTTLEPDTEYNYTTSKLSMSDVTIEKKNTKLYNARLVNGIYNGHDNKIDYGDKDNKFLKIQDSDRVFYQRSNENASRFYYYRGGYAISDSAFNGIVEDVSSKSEHGLTTYSVVGRDETSKLLSQTVTKNTTFMEDVIHTSIPPILNATAITGISSLSISGSNAYITWAGTPNLTPKRHGLIMNQAGELIGEVKQYEENYSSTSDRITCYDTTYATPTTTTSLLYYHPYDSTWVNYITGTKALASNELHDSGINGFTSISEKGLGFNSGLSLGGTFGVNSSAFTYDELKATSNTGNYTEDRTLGYDISSPKAVSTNDSIFAFNAGNENGVTVDKLDIATINKESFNVVQVNEKDEGQTTLSVAPIFPVVLGRLDGNSSDNRGNCNIYLVNNNIDTGGFIHRLQDTFSGSGYFGPKETIRYWDLQKFDAGTISKTHSSIYNGGRRNQKIQGYGVGYGVRTNGTVFTPTATQDNKPLAGSNTINGWTYVANFCGDQNDTPIIQSYPSIESQNDSIYASRSGYKTDGFEQDIQYSSFEQIDPKSETYELLAVGDSFPSSKLRHNNLGYHTKNYEDFSMVLESESFNTGKTSHQKYTGQTKQTLQSPNMFEEAPMSSATQTTNQARRFGVMRLVEATFDWHFNPVDYESLPEKAEDIPTVKTFDYVQADLTPTVETSTNGIAIDNDGVYVSDTVGESDGDVFYQKDKIGAYPASAYSNNQYAGGINGFVASHRADTQGTEWLPNVLYDVLNPGGASQTGLLRYEGSTEYAGVQPFRLFGTTDFNIDNLSGSNSSDEYKQDRAKGNNNIRFSHVWICSPTVQSTNFNWTKRLVNSSDVSKRFDGHDIIIPLISEEYKGTWDDSNVSSGLFLREPDFKDRRISAFNHFTSANGHRHISRVIAGLYHRDLSNTTANRTFRYSVGISNNYSGSLAHIYDGCIGVFRGFKQGADVHLPQFGADIIGVDDITLSTELTLDTEANYSAYVSSNTHDFEQTTRNTMVQQYTRVKTTVATAYTDGQTSLVLADITGFGLNGGNGWINGTPFSWTSGSEGSKTLTVPDLNADYAVGTVVEQSRDSLAMTGTKAKTSILALNPTLSDYDVDDEAPRLYRGTNATLRNVTMGGGGTSGTDTTHTKGGVFSAQMLVKPVFDFSNASVSSQTATFTLDSNTKHAWLSYMPDLTGYYLVSEQYNHDIPNGSTKATVRNTIGNNLPSAIMKITSHTVSTAPTTSATEVQQIVFDTVINTTTHGNKWRLMRPSEVTFENQEKEIKFNTLLDDGKGRDWRTGGAREGDDPTYSESVYHMYLLLDIDNANSTIERRTPALALTPFSDLADGDVLDMHVTDGQHNDRRKIVVKKTIEIDEDTSRTGLTLEFDGELNGNGVVSFGEVFDITLGRKPKLKEIKKCHIGTTYSIGSQLEKEVENIVKLAGLDYNATRSFSKPTGNIISSGTTSSTTITCTENVTGISNGDVIYTYDGHLIGEVSNVSSAVITLTKKYYAPAQNDEIVLINKKTFVTNLKFDNSNMYNALNSLIIKRGLDYRIKNGEFITRNIEDTDSLRKYALSYKESGRLIKVGANKSMFDKANKIIVIGDKVQYELEEPTKKQVRAVKVIDPTIKTRTDAETKAVELMEIYSEGTRKIDVELQKQGLELLEAGDIVRLNFPNHNIPIDDYMVFEIENVLAGTLKLKVGTFDKTIAERLSELSTRQSDDSTVLLGRDAVVLSAGKFLFDAIKLKNISFSYKITGSSNALSYNSNMGFDDLVGFTEEVGFEHSTVTKKSYQDKFYQQEDYA